MKAQGPYVLINDDDGHWYLIPEAQLSDWETWIRSDAWQDGEAPDYAESVGGSPSLVRIFSYQIT